MAVPYIWTVLSTLATSGSQDSQKALSWVAWAVSAYAFGDVVGFFTAGQVYGKISVKLTLMLSILVSCLASVLLAWGGASVSAGSSGAFWLFFISRAF